MTEKRKRVGLHVLRNLATLALALLVFYSFPAELPRSLDREAAGLVFFIAGAAGLGWLVVAQTRRLAVRDDHRGRLLGVLTVVYLVVVFFALTYYVIGLNDPDQFEGLATRTDALYYTVVTLGTVGYGDIHAVGQLARAATMIQIAFDLVLIGALFAVASSQLADRVSRRKEQSGN